MASRHSRGARQSLACRACRSRKLGCDKLKPSCTRCREASRVCQYDTNRPQTRTEYTFIDETPQASSSGGASGSVDPLALSQAGNVSSRESTQPTVEIPVSRLAAIESRLEALTSAIRLTRSPGEPVGVPRAGTEGLSLQPESTEPIDAEIADTDLSLGHLTLQGSGRARFVTGSFWANVCDEASAIDGLLRAQTRYTGVAASIDPQLQNPQTDYESELSDLMKTSSGTRADMYPFGDILAVLDDWAPEPRSSRYHRRMPDIVAHLPPRALCDHLFECYILYHHPVSPLVHLPSLRVDYEEFWNSNSLPRNTRRAQCAPLIVAVLFAGAVVCEESIIKGLSGHARGEIITDLHILTAKTLRYANFPRTPTIESFTAYLTVQNTCMREEQPLTCCSFAGTAVRVAQMLGCNHDPSRYPNLTPVAAEVRRRIGWVVYYIDALIALAAGLPPLIDTHSWSIRPISELKDELIGTPEGEAYDEAVRSGRREPDHVDTENSMVCAASVFAMGKYRQANMTRSFLMKLYGNEPVTGRVLVDLQNELDALKLETFARIDRLPKISSEDTQERDIIFSRWAGLLLSALTDKNWSYMYYPIAHAKEREKWEGVLKRVVSHSRSYLEKLSAIASLEEFGPLQWSWPGIHQPLAAMMVLIRFVGDYPYDSLADSIRQAIDEVLTLCSPDGGMTGIREGRLIFRPLKEGGQEAWELIRKLRARAWTKAGLDPDVLPTRAETIERVRSRLGEQGIANQWPPASQQPGVEDPGNVMDEDEIMTSLDEAAILPDFNVDWFQWD